MSSGPLLSLGRHKIMCSNQMEMGNKTVKVVVAKCGAEIAGVAFTKIDADTQKAY